MTESIFPSGWRYRALIGSVVLSATGYLGFSLWGGGYAVYRTMSRVGGGGIVVILLLVLTNYCLRFLRWRVYLRALGHVLPGWPGLKIYLAGFALTTTPGKVGEALRSVLLKQWHVPYAQSFAILFSERLSDLVAVVVLALFGLSLYPESRSIILFGALLVGFGLLVLSRKAFIDAFERRIPRSDAKPFVLLRSLCHVVHQARRCHTPGMLLGATFLSLLAWWAEALALHRILIGVGGDIPLVFAIFVYAVSMLAGALSFMPGGLGSTEAVMIALLIWKGMPNPEAIAATLLFRLATLWFAVGIGVAVLLIPRSIR
ncbi:lysylphosphatidylglycerol synthase transmembrane domain-containing protein [Pseudomonas sp. FEN]|uniref:lysylphosphatidylglycerol synthase transmembrane domain-containing protein n=1 Tax=Pseudomonas sp. FEN TaxID=2767468 RepID=UPI0017499A0F|nr:lysylphosphatidylglycerol synthase transmembrane domain-containing protein [Pseudomonas sp. FEN]CAD5200787.1 Integral membrane protein [Pseudomonas sp. FEN]